MRAPVIIYNASLNKVAYLPQAYNVSYEMRANEVGRASFSVPIDDVHVSEITQRRYAEIYDGDNRVELFRIVKIKKADNELKVDCEHVLATLTDTELSTTLYGSAGTSTAIGEVLALQSDWQLGTCDFNEQYLYEWPRGTTLLKALLDIPARFQEGYFWTFDTTSHPWTINLISPPTSVTAFIDYGRNMQSIEREEDVSQLVTKLYPHGAKAGADQIGITSVEPSGNEYIEDYSYTTDVITRHWTDQNYTTEQELYDAAVERLAIQAQPKYTYRVTASDLYRITGESTDRFSIGTLVRVINPDLDIESDVRVMSISKGDITGAPGEITLELANKGEEFSFVDVINTNDLSGIDINDIPGGTPGALPGAPSGTGLTITTDYLGYHAGSAWKTYMDEAGRLWADGGANAYFHFDPTVPSLEIKMTGGDSYDDIQQALADAATARATADGKIVSFWQTTAPTSGMNEGDIWFDTDDGNKVYRYDGADWQDAQDSDIAQALSDAATAQATADGKVVTFYQTSQPTAEGVGDLWVDTDDNYKLYRWSGSTWNLITGAVAHLNILTDAYIQSLSFDKITAATNTASLTIGGSGYIKSSNYAAGYAGFKISGNGNAEFNDVTVRGAIHTQYGSSINGGYLVSQSVHASKLYIDDDLNFAANGSYHTLYNIDALYFHSSSSYPKIEMTGSTGLFMSAGSGGTARIRGNSGGSHVSAESDSTVALYFGGDAVKLTGAATTGGQWGLGYINVTINGVARSIAIEHPH